LEKYKRRVTPHFSLLLFDILLSALVANVFIGVLGKTIPLFGFGGAISTLARQEGNPSRISIGDKQEGGGSIQGIHWIFTWDFGLLLERYGSV
jgi:hypothetical protein